MAKVYIHEGGAEQAYELFDDTPEVSLGRGAGNDVQIADVHASKQHLALRRVRGRWRMVDLESKSGTRVNGAFRNAAWLSQGDTVTIGTFVLRFDAEGQVNGPPPARAAAPMAARPAPAALPARPSAARPAPAAARPAAGAPARPPAAAPAPAAPLVTMRAPAQAPGRAPAPAQAPVPPSRSPSRSAPRRRHDEDADEGEEGARPVRRAGGLPGGVIALLIGLGAVVVFFVLQGALSGSNPNSVLREQAQVLREKRQYKQALEVLQRGVVPDSPGASAVLEEIEQLKVLAAQETLSARESEVFEFFNRNIARVIAVANLRPAGHPGDDEAAQILRRFFAQYGDTQLARTMLNARPTDNAQYAGYQQIMRENPDPKRDEKQALAEMEASVATLTQQNRLGAAYDRVRLSIQLERLSLAPEVFQRFEPRAQAQLATLEQQARTMLESELTTGRAMAQRGDKDLARTKVKTILALLAWPEPDLQRHADDVMRAW